MLDKESLEIGTEIYHNGLKRKGTFDETCFTLEMMNPDKSTVFVLFTKAESPVEVPIQLCEVVEFEPPALCQKCFRVLGSEEATICYSCAITLRNRMG